MSHEPPCDSALGPPSAAAVKAIELTKRRACHRKAAENGVRECAARHC